MEIAILNTAGKETGRSIELVDSIYAVEPSDHAIYLDVKQYLANQRQGTHKSKERGEITGSTRKLKRQKGTGTARAGSIKSPIFRGGGRAFGPQPRNYGFKLNKKLKALARKSALTYKAKSNDIVVMEDFNFEAPKTKEFVAIQNNLAVADKKSLIVLSEANKNIYLSSRNLQNAEVVTASELSTYKIMHAKKVVLVESSVKAMEEMFKI
ncbi:MULTISPECIES: 50S ribosomal protein L4 [Prolixibacter]|jgi:large subunit ribosomal protein L4|uniref:Large ribosomal subunit protein uL4 n=1 Tax=Prolixibacter denitrificans TaxID=1541063 RepID=A0A2P8CJR8_9BACT|nr:MULTISPECIES: 50S ribosomal protein L4 [Prolixibacter]PSK85201.1 large subunit ribosomal protein L4 [Prolixibacter denitrificans]GET19824.1 50S ribosomal protein L4 [Prolixibacter denitrificans]GET26517.1 50S ribosomal protein L4 [Prolixibacter sp. NT017]